MSAAIPPLCRRTRNSTLRFSLAVWVLGKRVKLQKDYRQEIELERRPRCRESD